MRPIDADTLIPDYTFDDGGHGCVCYTKEQIDNAPTVNRIRHGKWIYHGEIPSIYKIECSCCSDYHRAGYNYCPTCGAKMDLGT